MAPFYKHAPVPKFEAYASRRVPVKDGPFRVQIPCMRLPCGISVFDDGVQKRYSLDFAIDDGTFLAFLRQVEDACVLEVDSQSACIFADVEDEMTVDEIRSLFVSSVKQQNLGDLSVFRAKVDAKTNFYDSNGRAILVDRDSLHEAFRGYAARAIVEAKSVYFMNRNIGVSWRVDQIKLFPPQADGTSSSSSSSSASASASASTVLRPTKFHFRNVVRYIE